VRLKLCVGAAALVALLALSSVASANFQLRFGPAKRAISQETANICSQVSGCKSWSVHPCQRQSYHRIDCLSNYFFTDGAICSSVTTATYRQYAEAIVINHKRIRC
jgi:hypothetical protein